MRGIEAVSRLLYVEGVEITAVCDILPERVLQAQKHVERERFTGARRLFSRA
ncbi:MAG: hypothetical protein MZU84_01600 [Sphingobacterium sp.]|nr:hypothetical protein [Sphingobacterium sp.]